MTDTALLKQYDFEAPLLAATWRCHKQSGHPLPAIDARPQRPTGAASKSGAVVPLVLTDGYVVTSLWQGGERWVDELRGHGGDLRGIVLPLELKRPCGLRQELWGLDLLEWLRWSADDEGDEARTLRTSMRCGAASVPVATRFTIAPSEK